MATPARAQSVAQEVIGYIQRCGGSYSGWYVGIACQPRQRLFSDHNVDEKNDAWIYRQCENSAMARALENYFVNTLGTKGGCGGGDDATDCLYAYRITFKTRE
jgi:hypothetical protein